jgi:hypothetical protein
MKLDGVAIVRIRVSYCKKVERMNSIDREAVMKASPISYVKDAELRGSLFDPEDTSGVISSVYTKFSTWRRHRKSMRIFSFA